MEFNQSIFKAYDIRGKAPAELTPEVAHAVGKALADFLPAGEVAIGRDMRADSKQLAHAIALGLIEQGREVIDLGQITSDMMYFAVGNYNFAGGAMVTASHNDTGYNGIKLTGEGVKPIGEDSGLINIKQAIIDGSYKPSLAQGAIRSIDILSAWAEHALKFAPHLASLKVGIDAGNGMGGIIVPELQKITKLQISGLFLELDGSFPNHPANPLDFTNLRDLISLVKASQLDCGIAFDGDGDRAFMVDENGSVVTGSILGAILVEYFLKLNPGATILYNAIASRIVRDTILSSGGKAIRTKVGHSFIKADMRQHNAIFACEHSGHFYFRDNYNADSGLIAVLCVLNILSEQGCKLSQLCAPFRRKYVDSGEINFEVASKPQAIAQVGEQFSDGKRDDMDGMTINYPNWWFNLRASNTEPLLRLNIEAEDRETVDTQLDRISKIIKNSID
ncbi:phosphomannomutase/phosphoglucomutase [Candidatus Saccharibacteria bacterium]|nr:phosphomannomutase/phosphoglucomutase [Candidatus Saccharibacteria bacterium]